VDIVNKGLSLKYSRLVILVLGFIFSLQAAAASSQAAAANEPTDAIAQFVRAQMEKQRIPGLALLVSRNGEPIRLSDPGNSHPQSNGRVLRRLPSAENLQATEDVHDAHHQ